jgi:hypothetical protein
VALFNASHDTIEVIQTLLTEAGGTQELGVVSFCKPQEGYRRFRGIHFQTQPFDISPPYDENWQFFKTMRDADVMRGRGSVLTVQVGRKIQKMHASTASISGRRL